MRTEHRLLSSSDNRLSSTWLVSEGGWEIKRKKKYVIKTFLILENEKTVISQTYDFFQRGLLYQCCQAISGLDKHPKNKCRIFLACKITY